MPPPPGRGRGRRGGGGRGRGRGRGRALGLSPGPRRKEEDLSYQRIEEEEEEEEEENKKSSPPNSGSTVMADDESSTPSKSPIRTRRDPNVTMTDEDLQKSLDFSRDEEVKARLMEELERLKQDELENDILEETQTETKEDNGTDHKSRNHDRKMNSDNTKVVLTWVGRKGGVKNVKKSLKDLVKASKSVFPSSGTTYAICENYDTYQKGGLFPLFHISQDSGIINKLLNTENEVDPDMLGPENVVDQAVFEEVACITPPMQGSGATNTVLAVSAFKSIEPSVNPKLIKEWKQWTGARAFLQDIVMAGLECQKIRFFVKVSPSEEAEGFYYALTTEVGIREPSDEGLFVDTLQRFRVERWFGYNTIYRKH